MNVAHILQNHTDEELLAIYKSSKDAEVVSILFKRYYHLVFGVCMKYLKQPDDAKDACMQIFEKLMQDILKHEIQFFTGWLYRVAQNFCLMELRGRKYQTVSFELIQDPGVEYEGDTHPQQRKELMLNRLEEEIPRLSEEQALCVKLFYLEKKTYTEIMEQTGFTFMQVKSHIQNGKRNLKIKLGNIHE